MSIELVMPSNHLTHCRPPLLLPSIFPSLRVCFNESALRIRWPEYWSFSFSISPSNEYSRLISFSMGWLHLLPVQGTLKSLLQHHGSEASILRHSAFFMVQLSHPWDYWKNHSFDWFFRPIITHAEAEERHRPLAPWQMDIQQNWTGWEDRVGKHCLPQCSSWQTVCAQRPALDELWAGSHAWDDRISHWPWSPSARQTPVSNHTLSISSWKAPRSVTSNMPCLDSGLTSSSLHFLTPWPPWSSQKPTALDIACFPSPPRPAFLQPYHHLWPSSFSLWPSGLLCLGCPLILEAFPPWFLHHLSQGSSSDSRKSTPTLYQLTAMHSSPHWPYHVPCLFTWLLDSCLTPSGCKFHKDRNQIYFVHW